MVFRNYIKISNPILIFITVVLIQNNITARNFAVNKVDDNLFEIDSCDELDKEYLKLDLAYTYEKNRQFESAKAEYQKLLDHDCYEIRICAFEGLERISVLTKTKTSIGEKWILNPIKDVIRYIPLIIVILVISYLIFRKKLQLFFSRKWGRNKIKIESAEGLSHNFDMEDVFNDTYFKVKRAYGFTSIESIIYSLPYASQSIIGNLELKYFKLFLSILESLIIPEFTLRTHYMIHNGIVSFNMDLYKDIDLVQYWSQNCPIQDFQKLKKQMLYEVILFLNPIEH